MVIELSESVPVYISVNIAILILFRNRPWFPLIYNVISLIGMAYLGTYHFNFGDYHAPYGDDSFFFGEAVLLAESNVIDILKPYESILAIIILILQKVGYFSFSNVLIVNWLIPTIFIVLLRRYISLKFNYNLDYKELFGFIMLNFIFQDILVHLYRDALIYGLTFFFLIEYEKYKSEKKILFIPISAVVLFFIFVLRGANCFLLVFYIVIDTFLYSKKNINKWNYKTTLTIAVFFSIIAFSFIFLFQNILIGSISRFGNQSNSESFSDLSTSRQERFFENLDGNQNTVMIYNLGVIGYPLRLISQVYSPITFKGIDRHDFRISVKYSSFTVPVYKDYTVLFYWASIFLWIYVLPIITIGIYRSYRTYWLQPYLLLFLLSVVMVAFVSMQPRHRLMFMIAYPIFIATYRKSPLSSKERTIFIYSKRFAVLSVGLSLVYFLIN